VDKQLSKMNMLFKKQFKRDIPVTEGYRPDEDQEVLYQQALKQYGPEKAGIWVAPPGTSRHRFGTEIDLHLSDMTDEEKRWIEHNAQLFGFKNRYPWEPWHYGMDVSNPQPMSQSANLTPARPPVTPPVQLSMPPMAQTPQLDVPALRNPFRTAGNNQDEMPGQLPLANPIAKYPVPYNTNPNDILQNVLRGMT
jgi:hypothetical protein